MNYEQSLDYLIQNENSLSEDDKKALDEIIGVLEKEPNNQDYKNLIIEQLVRFLFPE